MSSCHHRPEALLLGSLVLPMRPWSAFAHRPQGLASAWPWVVPEVPAARAWWMGCAFRASVLQLRRAFSSRPVLFLTNCFVLIL